MLIQFIESGPNSNGGVNRAGMYLFEALHHLGHDLVLRSPEPWQAPESWRNSEGTATWIPIPPTAPGSPASNGPRAWYRHAKGLVRTARDQASIHRRLRSLGPIDVTMLNGIGHHGFLQRAGGAGRACLLIQASPRHYTTDDRATWPPHRRWVIDRMNEFNAFICASETVRQEWISLGAFCDKPSFTVPNRCDDDLARSFARRSPESLRDELKLPQNRFVVTCVASIQHRKGQDLILDELQAVVHQIPNVLILIVGPVIGEWGAQFVEQARAAFPPDVIRILEPRPQAMDVIRASNVLVLPSRAEAMPLVVLEAMALGTPVVATDVDGTPELIEHGRTGFLFSVDRPSEMVEGLAAMARQPLLRQELAEQARQRYWHEFSAERQRSRLETIMQDPCWSHGVPEPSNRFEPVG